MKLLLDVPFITTAHMEQEGNLGQFHVSRTISGNLCQSPSYNLLLGQFTGNIVDIKGKKEEKFPL